MTTKLVVFVDPLCRRLDLLVESPVRSYTALSRLAADIAILRKPEGLVYVGAHDDMSMLDHYLISARLHIEALARGSYSHDEVRQAIRYMSLAKMRAAKIEVHGMPTGSVGEWQEVTSMAGARLYEKTTVSTFYNSRKSPFGRWMEVDRIESMSGEAIEVWTPMDPAGIRA